MVLLCVEYRFLVISKIALCGVQVAQWYWFPLWFKTNLSPLPLFTYQEKKEEEVRLLFAEYQCELPCLVYF